MEKELYTGEAKFNGPVRIIVTIAIPVIAIMLFFLLQNSDTDRVNEKAEQAVQALATGDVAQWQTTIHPELGVQLMDMGVLSKELESKGIILKNDSSLTGDGTFVTGEIRNETHIQLERDLRSGDRVYVLIAVYVFGDEAEGFAEFEIKTKHTDPLPCDTAIPHGW